MNTTRSLHLCINNDICSFLSQGKAVTDNGKINYGDRQKDRKEKCSAETGDRGRERGVSGKWSNEKTSDFWASHRQPFLESKTRTHMHAHGGKCLLAVRFMC